MIVRCGECCGRLSSRVDTAQQRVQVNGCPHFGKPARYHSLYSLRRFITISQPSHSYSERVQNTNITLFITFMPSRMFSASSYWGCSGRAIRSCSTLIRTSPRLSEPALHPLTQIHNINLEASTALRSPTRDQMGHRSRIVSPVGYCDRVGFCRLLRPPRGTTAMS